MNNKIIKFCKKNESFLLNENRKLSEFIRSEKRL